MSGHRAHGQSVDTFDRSLVRTALVGMVAIKVAGLVVLFDPASALAFEGPKSSLSLAMASLLLGCVAIAVLRYGWATFPRTRMHLLVAGFVIACALAAAFAEDRYVALFGAQRRLGLTFVVDMAILYAAVALAYRTRRDWAILGATVACAGLVAMTYGLLQSLDLDPVPWTEDTSQRPPSTFGNPDKFGHFLGATVVGGLGLSLAPSLPRRIRVLAVGYTLAALATAALVATRGTVLGIVVALPALGLIYLRLSRFAPQPRTIIGLVAGTVGAMALAAGLVAATPLGERVRGGFTDPGTQQRLFVADAAIRAFLDRPLTGHGPDNFGAIYPKFRPPGSIATGGLVNQDSAHSLPLQTLATTGIFGALGLGAIALMSVAMLWRATPASPHIAIPLLVGAIGYWAQSVVAIGSVSVDWMGWLAAGGAASVRARPAAAALPRNRAVLQAIAALMTLLLAISGYSAFQANRELYAARVARVVARPDRAITRAEQAIRLDSGRSEHWFALGLARQDGKMLPDAARALRGATDRAPFVATYWSTLALTLTNLALAGDNSVGGKDAALVAARRGTEADPNHPTPYNVLAVVANALGEHAEALKASATAIRLFKGDSEYEAVAADAALRLADAVAARSALEDIVREKDAPVLRVALARLALKMNDAGSARMHIRRALELDPKNGPARELAAQLGVSAP